MARNGPRRGPSRARSSTSDDLVAVAFDDAVLDRLAARSRRSEDGRCPRWAADASTDWISDQFAKWQDRLVRPTAPARMDADQAAALVASAPRRSSLRPAFAVVAAIFALLIGSAVVGARSARPGDPLFPVTQVFWSDQADSAVAGEEVRGVIDAARDAMRVGQTGHAAVLLTRASVGLARISDQADHAAVQRELDAAWDLLAAATAPSWADTMGAASAGPPVQAVGPPVVTTLPAAPSTEPSQAALAPAASSAADDGTTAGLSSAGPSTAPLRPSGAGDPAPTSPSTTSAATPSSVPAAPPPPAAGTSASVSTPTTHHDDDQAAPASTTATPPPPTSAAQKPSTSSSAPAVSTKPSATSAPATTAPTTSDPAPSSVITGTSTPTTAGAQGSPAGLQDESLAQIPEDGLAVSDGRGTALVAPTPSAPPVTDATSSPGRTASSGTAVTTSGSSTDAG